MPPRINVTEEWFPAKCFTTIGGFTAPDFTKVVVASGAEQNEDGNYPIFKILEYVNQLRKNMSTRGRTGAINPEDEDDVGRELKREQVLKARIDNQEKLKQLIPVPAAKRRMQTTLQAVANKIRYAIKQSAPSVAICNNPRDCENILIQNYNGAIELLSSELTVQSWEEYSASHQPGRTELVTTAGTNTGNGSSQKDEASSEG
jgi:hypothetical protein